MKSLLDWLEERTGGRKIAKEFFFENIPGGPRWRYVWGSTVLFALFVQIVTGTCLWMCYSPSTQTAWESVNYIQNNMAGGWLLRGIHHFTAQIILTLAVLHLMQIVIDRAYKAPRELNFWLTLILLQLIAFLALTGYQLPWDQKGYVATKVATNILGIVPFVGQDLQRLVIGGPEFGHHTLTRFFALHAGVLPASAITIIALRAYLTRRNGRATRQTKEAPGAPFWPDQFLRNAVACLAVLATVLFFISRNGRTDFFHGTIGADLGSPADPSEPYAAGRPDWSFLFLFQFLKSFPGRSEIIGAIIIPSLVMLVMVLMPFIGRWRLGPAFNVCFLGILLLGAGTLTWRALSEDATNASYQSAVKAEDQKADRTKALVRHFGVPPEGALALLRSDPLTQGPKLFAKNCASCHRYGGSDGLGGIPSGLQSASDLKGFGSREWISGLLDPNRVSTTNYFGGTKFADGKMAKVVKRNIAKLTPEEHKDLEKVIAAVSAEAGLLSQAEADKRDAGMIEEGRKIIKDTIDCAQCHAFRGEAGESAPVFDGYASRAWMIDFLMNPGSENYYGDHNDRMPAFGEKKILTAQEIGLITDWLRGDWPEVQ